MYSREVRSLTGPVAAALITTILTCTNCNALQQEGNLAPNQTVQTSPTLEQTNKYVALTWERTLSAIAASEHTSLFFFVPVNTFAPRVSISAPHGKETMRALASTYYLDWRQVGGVQVFRWLNMTEVLRASTRSIFTTLVNQDADTLSKLMTSGLNLYELDEATADAVRGQVSACPGLGLALLDNSDVARVALDITPRFTFTDLRTGQSRTAELSPRQRPDGLFNMNELNRKGASVKRNLVPLAEQEPSRLDFGPGKVRTLADIIARAAAAFGVDYELDPRIAANTYFVCGRMSKGSFEGALEFATAVPAVRPQAPRLDLTGDIAALKQRVKASAPHTIDVTYLRAQITNAPSSAGLETLAAQYGPTEQLDTSQFLDGATTTGAALFQNSPGLAAYLQQQGITANTQLTLSFGTTLALGTPGLLDFDSGWNGSGWGVGKMASQLLLGLYP